MSVAISDVGAFVSGNWGLIVGAIVPSFIAFYFFLKRRTTANPRYAIKGENLIQGLRKRFSELAVLYHGELTDTATATRVALWNGGPEPIQSGDIPDADGTRLSLPLGFTILDIWILPTGTAPNNFKFEISADRTTARIRFDFLERAEGVVLQVLHTSPSPKDVRVEGRVIGSGRWREYRPIRERWSYPILYVGFIGLTVLTATQGNRVFGPDSPLAIASIVLAMGLFFALISWGIVDQRRRGVPNSLRAAFS